MPTTMPNEPKTWEEYKLNCRYCIEHAPINPTMRIDDCPVHSLASYVNFSNGPMPFNIKCSAPLTRDEWDIQRSENIDRLEEALRAALKALTNLEGAALFQHRHRGKDALNFALQVRAELDKALEEAKSALGEEEV